MVIKKYRWMYLPKGGINVGWAFLLDVEKKTDGNEIS